MYCDPVFQCSSASRKFLNRHPRQRQHRRTRRFSALQRAENFSICDRQKRYGVYARFSALQRAENFSIGREYQLTLETKPRFQCSSASRKFLNCSHRAVSTGRRRFQCSSASRKFLNRSSRRDSNRESYVSVLFSEPKISQW